MTDMSNVLRVVCFRPCLFAHIYDIMLYDDSFILFVNCIGKKVSV